MSLVAGEVCVFLDFTGFQDPLAWNDDSYSLWSINLNRIEHDV